jgi:hypothetical protein
MKKVCLILLLTWSGIISAKETFLPTDSIKTKKNSVFVEAFGRAGVYTFGYERILFSKGLVNLSASAGFALYPSQYGFALPASVDLDLGRKNRLNIFICTPNVFNEYLTAKNISDRRQAIKDGHGCPPESIPLYRRMFEGAIGYKRMLAKNKLSLEIYVMGVVEVTQDMDHMSNVCRQYVNYAPWGGIKFNYFF